MKTLLENIKVIKMRLAINYITFCAGIIYYNEWKGNMKEMKAEYKNMIMRMDDEAIVELNGYIERYKKEA